MIKVRLSGRKVLELDNMVKTSFWSADGTPISSDQFIKNLFGEIPSCFRRRANCGKFGATLTRAGNSLRNSVSVDTHALNWRTSGAL